ncbi:PAS domain S-box protein [Methanolobus mangrovi]|uniref:histidine kinase n=1 Tax=Methanolobus mangrovi TaxID=3072977 RepID=A0AA51UJS5_9EURY|nr:PAS domain S-box protein [Methanolobus mangrovi]WMW22991.1 PAS domain S-box protein [Methanolobus mangrovi]
MKKLLLLSEGKSKNADILQRIKSNGYSVYERLLNTENLDSFVQHEKIDVILLYFGSKAASEIANYKSIHEIRNVPIILIAFSLNDTYLQLLEEFSFSNYLIEPISDDQLRASIELSCSKHVHNNLKNNSDIEPVTVEYAKRYRTITEMAVDGFWYIDVEGRILEVNSKYCEMSGYSYEELLGMSVFNLEAYMTLEQIIYLIDRTKKVGKDLFETHHRRKDGKILDIEVSSIYSDMIPPGIFCFLRDISDRKELEQSFKESERSKSVILSNLPGMAYRCNYDRDWTMQFVSEGCYELTGYNPEDLLGNRTISFNDLIEPEYREHLWNKWERTLARNETFQDEYTITTASGENKWVWEQGKGIRDDKDNIIALEGFITDITQHRIVEEELRESEARYRNLFENNHSVMLIIDPDSGVIIDANPAAVKYYGWTREELQLKSIMDINTMSPSEIEEEMGFARIEHRNYFHFRHLLANGSVKDVEVFSGPITRKGRTLLYSIIHDITKRKLAEEALLKSEELFRTTLYSIGDGVITTDTAGRLQQMNHIAEELTGWTEAEAKGKQLEEVFDIINEHTRLPVEIPVRRVLREGQIVGLANHTLLISKDGTEIPIADSGSPIVDKNGRIVGVVLVFRDQSDERTAQDAIAESEARFRLLVENAPEAIFVQTDWKFAYLNPAALKLLGADSQEQFIGQPVLDNFHFDSHTSVKERIHLLNDKKQSVPTIEEICLRLDGSSFLAEVSAVPVTYDGSEGALVFFRDITERKQAEEEILKAKMVSDNANRSKSEFLANTSHELKTPLSSIIGFSDLLLEGNMGELSDKQRKYVGTINQNGHLLHNLINNILDISQIEFGEMELNCQRFNLANAIQDVYLMMSILSNKKDITITMNIALEQTEIVADNIKIKEILYNLIDNALKFTPKGGTITINAMQRDSEYVQMSVGDTGIGISMQGIERIFDPFYQADGSSTRRYRGTGLGLAIIKKFVKMHGGNIWVKSEVGKGSVFFFTIPINKYLVVKE